jgi:hypothetical protein
VTFESGETVTATSTTPCRAAPLPPATRRLTLTISPARVTLGRRVRFHLRVTGPQDCIDRATIRFGGRNWRAGSGGRRAFYALLRRAGMHRATVAAPGCRAASATVRAVR